MSNKESATKEFLLLFRGGDGNSQRKDSIARGCPILQFDSGNVEVRAIQEM